MRDGMGTVPSMLFTPVNLKFLINYTPPYLMVYILT